MLGCMKQDVEELERYLKWAEQVGNADEIEPFCRNLVFHATSIGEFAKAERYMEVYDRLVDETRKTFWPVACMGKIHIYRGNYEVAVAHSQKELAEDATQSNERRKANFLGRLRRANLLMGKMSWHDALSSVLDVIDLYAEKSRSSPGTHAGLGKIYLAMGEWGKAISECETALSMSPSLVWMSTTVTPLGDAYCKAGQLDKGIALLERWKAYAQRVGHGAISECEYCLPLAEGYLALGDIDKARANADRALGIAVAKGFPLHEAQAHRILGEILTPANFLAAEDHFSHSLEIMQRIKARNEEGITQLSWGRAYQQHGDADRARVHLNHAAEIFEELGTTRYLEWTQEAIAALEEN